MGWDFNFRSSSLTGPVISDVRFQLERIAYELSLSEIAVFNSGISPFGVNTDFTILSYFVFPFQSLSL